MCPCVGALLRSQHGPRLLTLQQPWRPARWCLRVPLRALRVAHQNGPHGAEHRELPHLRTQPVPTLCVPLRRWRTKIDPVLKDEESRSNFDIQLYAERIISRLQEAAPAQVCATRAARSL